MFEGLFGTQDDRIDEEQATSSGGSSQLQQKAIPKPSGERGGYGYVGLTNQGATCYLNALLQTMYMTEELREGLFSVDPKDLGAHQVEEYEKEQHAKNKKEEFEADENMLSSLVSMGVDKAVATLALIRTKNAGIEQAFDCILDYGDAMEEEAKSKSKPVSKGQKPRYIPLELQRLFSELQGLNINAVSTQELTTKGFQWQSAEGHVQHDAHELNRLLIEALERSLKRTSRENLCKELYQGSISNQVLCTKCHHISTREEAFYDLNLQVIDCPDAVQALHQYCKREVLEGDSAYDCDVCRAKTPALRCTSLQHLPPILTFSCSRFRIDASTLWERVKVPSKCTYPLLLDMKRFVEEYEVKQQASHSYTFEEEEQYVQSIRDQMLWINVIWKDAYDYANDCIRCSNLTKMQIWTNKEVEKFRAKYSQSIKFLDYNYILHSMIIHRGSAYSGHYYAYIRDYSPHRPSEKMVSVVTDLQPQIEKRLACAIGDNTTSLLTSRKELKYANGQYYTSPDSLLSKFLSLFLAEEQKYMEAVKANKKKKAKKQGEFSLTIPVISQELPHYVEKKTWAKHYKQQYGSLEQYLSQYKEIFKEIKDGQYTLQSFVNVVSVEEYDKLVSSKEISSQVEENSVKTREEDEDAMIAKAIADSLAFDSINTPNISPNADSKDKTTEHDQTYDLLTASMAELMLVQCFGQFYEFNDQIVKPISYIEMDQAFQGLNSAYLLVYRKFKEEERAERIACALPSYWQEYIAKQNNLLINQKEEYEKSLSTISLSLYHIEYDQEFYQYNPPLFTLPHHVKGTVIEIHTGSTIQHLLRSYQEKLKSMTQHTIDNIDEYRIGTLDYFDKYQNCLRSYLSGPLPLHSTIQSLSSCKLFLWPYSVDSISSHILYYGLLHTPISLSVHHLHKTNANTTNRSSALLYKLHRHSLSSLWIEDMCYRQVALVSSCTLYEFISHLCQISFIGYDKAIIHIENKDKTLEVLFKQGQFNSALWQKHDMLKRKGLVLEDSHSRCINEYSLFNASLDGKRSFLEVYIEDLEDMGLDRKMLIEKKRNFEKEAIRVYITLTDHLHNRVTKLLTSRPKMQDKEGKEEDLGWMDELQFEMSKVASVLEVKHEFSYTLCQHLSSIEDDSTLVTEVKSLLEGLFVHSDSLAREGIKDQVQLSDIVGNKKVNGKNAMEKVALFLSLPNANVIENLPEEIVSVNIELVTDNNPETGCPAYLSLADRGQCSGKCVTLSVVKEITVRELRDFAGQQLLSYPAGWTLVEDQRSSLEEIMGKSGVDFKANDFKGHRLRYTNWCKEAGSLVAELDYTLPRAEVSLSDLSLKHGETLLLERGPKHVRGSVQIDLLTFSPHTGSNTPETSTIKYSVEEIKKMSLEQIDTVEKEIFQQKFSFFQYKDAIQGSVQLSLSEVFAKIGERLGEREVERRYVLRDLSPLLLPGRRVGEGEGGVLSRLTKHSLSPPFSALSSSSLSYALSVEQKNCYYALVLEEREQGKEGEEKREGGGRGEGEEGEIVYIQELKNLSPVLAGRELPLLSPPWPPLRLSLPLGLDRAGRVRALRGEVQKIVEGLGERGGKWEGVCVRYQPSLRAYLPLSLSLQSKGGGAWKEGELLVFSPPMAGGMGGRDRIPSLLSYLGEVKEREKKKGQGEKGGKGGKGGKEKGEKGGEKKQGRREEKGLRIGRVDIEEED